MSSRRGRRQRGRARSWDPEAVRALRAGRLEGGGPPMPEDGDHRYWHGRLEKAIARRERDKDKKDVDVFGMLTGRGQRGGAPNRKMMRDHGIGVRGAIWSRRHRAAKRKEDE